MLWVAKAWAISAVVMLVVLALFARFTTWGRQFWRSPATTSRDARAFRSGRLLRVLLLSVMISVRMDVLFSYYLQRPVHGAAGRVRGRGAGDEAVRASGASGFWVSIFVLAALLCSPT